jgi:hypothetical protein
MEAICQLDFFALERRFRRDKTFIYHGATHKRLVHGTAPGFMVVSYQKDAFYPDFP